MRAGELGDWSVSDPQALQATPFVSLPSGNAGHPPLKSACSLFPPRCAGPSGTRAFFCAGIALPPIAPSRGDFRSRANLVHLFLA